MHLLAFMCTNTRRLRAYLPTRFGNHETVETKTARVQSLPVVGSGTVADVVHFQGCVPIPPKTDFVGGDQVGRYEPGELCISFHIGVRKKRNPRMPRAIELRCTGSLPVTVPHNQCRTERAGGKASIRFFTK